MKRYLILPGKVYSKTDMDTHYVSANELMRLYSVTPEECVVLHNEGVHGRVGLDNDFLDSLLWPSPSRRRRSSSSRPRSTRRTTSGTCARVLGRWRSPSASTAKRRKARMTEFTKEQLQHIIVLNADRLFDTQAQPGWKKEKLVEAIIEKAQMIVETDDGALEGYRIVGQTILDYVRDIERVNNPPLIVDTTGDLVDLPLRDVAPEIDIKPNPGAVYNIKMPTHTPGLIAFNVDDQIWEAVRDVKNGETEEEFNKRRADFHKAEREHRRVDAKPAATPQQHLARVFGKEE